MFGIMAFTAATLVFLPSCSKEDEGSISATDLSLAQDGIC